MSVLRKKSQSILYYVYIVLYRYNTAKPHFIHPITFFSVGTTGVEKRNRRQIICELFKVCEQRTDVDEHVPETRTQENLDAHLQRYHNI